MQAKTWFVMAWLVLLADSAIYLFTQKDKTYVFVALVLSHICWQAAMLFVMAWLVLLADSAIYLFTQKDKAYVFVALVLSHICWQAARLIPTDRKGGEDA